MIRHLSKCPLRWDEDSDQLCICNPGNERIVVRYQGANLIDAGAVIRVRFTGASVPVGLRTKLRNDVGFKTGPNDSLQRTSNTSAIFQTRAILNETLGEVSE